MKGRMPFLGALAILFSLIAFGANAQDKYVPKSNEELYGTWINDKSINADDIQKQVSTPQGNKEYFKASDTVPVFDQEQQIYAKWTDSEGNTWYKIFGTNKAGAYKGTKWQRLYTLSESATVCEYVYTIVGEFSANSYPTKIDAGELHYRIFYRAEK